jgi:hypothetical protein
MPLHKVFSSQKAQVNISVYVFTFIISEENLRNRQDKMSIRVENQQLTLHVLLSRLYQGRIYQLQRLCI